jgi:nucleotide-binding universal stress UspA family protein
VTALDDSAERRQQERRLQAELERQAAAARSWLAGHGLVPAFTHWEPEVVLCAGPPAATLRHLAVDGRYDLLVVGCRGHGRGNALLGSTATALAAGSKVPVLLAGQVQPERAGRTAHAARSAPRAAG